MDRSPGWIAERLRRLGHLRSEGREDAEALADAVCAAQASFGLPATGELDINTQSTLGNIYCGRSLAIVQGGVYKWADGSNLKYYIDRGSMPTKLGLSEWQACSRAAAQSWVDVCGIRLTEIATPSGANIVIKGGARDGSSGVLADCELPTGIERQRALVLTLDWSEAWSAAIDQRGIAARNVLAHELGHALGFDHVDVRRGKALMNPMYAWNVVAPTAVDISIAVQRYGQRFPETPSPAPQPQPSEPGTPGEMVIRVRSTGEVVIDGYTIVKRIAG